MKFRVTNSIGQPVLAEDYQKAIKEYHAKEVPCDSSTDKNRKEFTVPYAGSLKILDNPQAIIEFTDYEDDDGLPDLMRHATINRTFALEEIK